MKKGIFAGVAAMAAAAAAVIVLSGPAYNSLDKSGKRMFRKRQLKAPWNGNQKKRKNRQISL